MLGSATGIRYQDRVRTVNWSKKLLQIADLWQVIDHNVGTTGVPREKALMIVLRWIEPILSVRPVRRIGLKHCVRLGHGVAADEIAW